jgi:transient receptor potential cation channel subfamily M protein 8
LIVSKDGWITTGGTHAGIMKYVGQAVKQYGTTNDKLVLLGIANWTTVTNREVLVKDFSTVIKTIIKK